MVGNINNPNHILGPGIIKEKNPLARMKEFFAQLSTLWSIPLLDFMIRMFILLMIGMFILLMIWGIIRDWGYGFRSSSRQHLFGSSVTSHASVPTTPRA